ncbi:hypothetical protein ACFPRL_14885 [Pseudoclavibacter helvolus]
MTAGPAARIAVLEATSRPAPMTPPRAIIDRCRGLSVLARASPCSTAGPRPGWWPRSLRSRPFSVKTASVWGAGAPSGIWPSALGDVMDHVSPGEGDPGCRVLAEESAREGEERGGRLGICTEQE